MSAVDVELMTVHEVPAVLEQLAERFADLGRSYDQAEGAWSAVLADEMRRSAAQLRMVIAAVEDGQLSRLRVEAWTEAAETYNARMQALVDWLATRREATELTTIGMIQERLRESMLTVDGGQR